MQGHQLAFGLVNPAFTASIDRKFAGLEKSPVSATGNVLMFNDFQSINTLCKQIIFPVNIILKMNK